MNINKLSIAVVALGAGLGAGYWWATQATMEPATHMAGTQAPEKRPLFYRNPMNPAITSPVPAKDEMGMAYVPVYAESGGGDEPAGKVSIDPVTYQNMGVRTAMVARRNLSREVHAAGRVDFDEEHLALLHPKIEGWIENLRVDKTGERIRKDDILLGIYSPQLVSSEQEYLLALKNAAMLAESPFPDIRRGAGDLVHAARDRLQLFDVPEHQIRELEKTGKVHKTLHIHSPFDGVVIKVGAREGQYVTPQTELFSIADLSTVWVYGDIFEQDLPWVKEGDEAIIRVAAVPGREFHGRIAYIYPYLEASTRTVKVRMVFDNADGKLKPEMFAEVTVSANRQIDAIVVPSEAIIRSGSRDQVFVVREKGKFEPRDVTVGVSSGGQTQILSGLQVGESVVTSAQFMIDSESKLREATAKMLEANQANQANQAKPVEPVETPAPEMQMHPRDTSGIPLGDPEATGPRARHRDMGDRAMPGMTDGGRKPHMGHMKADGQEDQGPKP